MSTLAHHLWLVPALPLVAAGLGALARQRHRTFAASLAIASMGLAFVLSCVAFGATLNAIVVYSAWLIVVSFTSMTTFPL